MEAPDEVQKPPAGRRSLKTQQHAGRSPRHVVSSCDLPGPVDISSGRTQPQESAAELRELKTTILPAFGAPKGSLERR